MKVLNEYPNSHHYWETYEKVDLFCCNCGKKEVWTALAGDYYVGPMSLCTNCKCACYYVNGPLSTSAPNIKLQLEQLKSGIIAVPTTKKGT